MMTPSQEQRRRRILSSARGALALGGYDGLQMREVATDADVALGTLYRYFPSKEHLILSLMASDIRTMGERLGPDMIVGDTPAERITQVLHIAHQAMMRNSVVTAAHVRALVSGRAELTSVVAEVTTDMRDIIAGAVGENDPADSSRTIAVADTLFDVWLGALVAWLTSPSDGDDLVAKLDRTIALIFSAEPIQRGPQ